MKLILWSFVLLFCVFQSFWFWYDLLNRLVLHGFFELKVNGDGNCEVYLQYSLFCFTFVSRISCFISVQANSINTYLFFSGFFFWTVLGTMWSICYCTPEHHRFVRQQVMKQVLSKWLLLLDFPYSKESPQESFCWSIQLRELPEFLCIT
jgi:hypothetical protein